MNVTAGGGKRLRRAVVRLLLAVIVGGLVLKGLVSAAESKLVFFPSAGEDETPATLGLRYSVVRVETADGERLHAWQLEPDRAIADVVYFHGNGGNLSVWLPVFAALHHLDLRVLAVDYRGYGLSSGTPSEAGLYRDAEAIVREAQRMRGATPARPLIYWGRSLGGPVAASATRIAAPDGLILESTFANKAAVVRSNPVLRALNVFSSYRFDTLAMARDFAGPVLVVHGDRDSIIPFALGRELQDAIGSRARFVRIERGDHNDFFDPSREDYWRPILQFVRSLAVPSN